jgi:hypothetical protein
VRDELFIQSMGSPTLGLVLLILYVLNLQTDAFHTLSTRRNNRQRSLSLSMLETAPYEDIIPFLSEHVQDSDQILFVGCDTDLCVQLVKAGYGTVQTGSMTVIDSNEANLKAAEAMASSDPECNKWMNNGKLKFQVADLTNMPDICKQSCVDAIVDYGGLDSVLNSDAGKEGMLKTIDHLQDAVRLGNILVCLSKEEKERFCGPFDERFGWVQELDGDPGEISAWYRGKTNIAATKSNFNSLGLKMYVYTNTDNC